MEVEEVLYGDPFNGSDVASGDSESNEAPAHQMPPKAPPRRRCSGASKPSRAVQRGVTLLEDSQPIRTYSPGTCPPIPKPRRGKGEASPVPTPEASKATGAPPVAGAQRSTPPESVKGNPPQAGGTPAQPTTGGQAGAPVGPPGLFTSPSCNFVPVPSTVSAPITLSVPVAWSPFMSVTLSMSVPVSAVVLIPVLPPAVLLALARVRRHNATLHACTPLSVSKLLLSSGGSESWQDPAHGIQPTDGTAGITRW
ncbi:hypothetical protein P4O66_004373 [Electrophorus voltai]|uniref:Uncharacterized protein n=1 Tax=Electrophorus voltai TaxID=2609070 RepID=A0AAD8ZNM2_9TELE|nr:hypothetical protein P4O66_004373 [Electrophorus voltai]